MLLEKGRGDRNGGGGLEEVPVPEDVLGVHKVLDRLDHPQAHVGDSVPHPLLPKFPHSMVM